MSEVPVALASTPQLLDETSLRRTITRLAHEVRERHPGLHDVVLAGIPTRGVPLAQRLSEKLGELHRVRPPAVMLDPHNFRDDRPRGASNGEAAVRGIDGAATVRVDGAKVIVVDDVLFTGRTVRAAMDALIAQGRPAAVEVLVLIDRGHRELPLRATYVGKNVPTSVDDRVSVRLREIDGMDGAWLQQGNSR
jgi:pyrimidine operon attenuation protein/uracil phosphoribosyltransferase